MRTVFNVLGPLCNPAGACDGVYGVHAPGLAHVYAAALAGLGARRAFVVHGDGLDELSPLGPNLVVEVAGGDVSEWELDPRTLGFYPADPSALAGGTPAENAAAVSALLAGERGPRRDAVILNAAAALVAADVAADLGEGVGLAAEAIDTGQAADRLLQLAQFSGGELG